MARLAGKSVIVTGGGVGIGEAIARIAAGEGAKVLVADIDDAAAAAAVAEIRDSGGVAEGCHLDLADERSVSEMIDAATKRFGGLHAIVNNAADTSLTAKDSSVEAIDLAIWDRTMTVNLRGTMLACRFAIPALRANGGGAIVNISSGAALKGGPGLSAYGVSKAGILTLGQYIAAQHGREGIRCNTIAPGIVITPKTRDAFGAPEVLPRILPHLLSPRLGQPEDIGGAVLWLISDEGAYVNGQCISIDGGQMSHQNRLMSDVSGE